MTQRQIEKWKARFDKRMDIAEKYQTAYISRHLARRLKDVNITIAGAVNVPIISPVDLFILRMVSFVRIFRIFTRWYSGDNNITNKAIPSYDIIVRTILESFGGEFWNSSVKDSQFFNARLVKTIEELTQNRGFLALNEREAARIIQSRVANVSTNQARRMVRTHSTAAANAAIITKAEESFRAEDMEKEWISAYDGRVRPAHRIANGQKRDVPDLFQVGGEALPFPGGGKLPANNIYCRCTMAVVPVAGAVAKENEVDPNPISRIRGLLTTLGYAAQAASVVGPFYLNPLSREIQQSAITAGPGEMDLFRPDQNIITAIINLL